MNKCGSAFLSFDTISQYETVGQAGALSTRCERPLQVLVNVGVMRCYPVPEDGSAPPQAAMDAAVSQMLRDMSSVQRAITCCYEGDIDLGPFTVIGPDGGCFGGFWQVFIDLTWTP